eukprot:3793765-Rhodomonas_salina.1
MEKGFNIDINKKQWSLNTGTHSLVTTKARARTDEHAVTVDHCKTVLGTAHSLHQAFEGATTIPFHCKVPVLQTPEPSALASEALPAEGYRLQTLPLYALLCLHLVGLSASLAVVPVFMNYGVLAPYYIATCTSPVTLSAIVLHVLTAFCHGDRYAAATGAVFIRVLLPVVIASLRDVHGHISEGSWTLHLSLLLLQLFYCLTLRENRYLAVLGAVALFAFPTATIEISHAGSEAAVVALLSWEALAAVLLALGSARQYVAESATVIINT